MNDYAFSVKFIYNGKEPKGFMKAVIEHGYMTAYNRFCDQVKPQLEKWNAEYDKLGLEDTKTSVDENNHLVSDHPYNMFIREKYYDIAKRIREYPFKRFQIGSEINLEGVLNDGTVMYFVLAPVK